MTHTTIETKHRSVTLRLFSVIVLLVALCHASAHADLTSGLVAYYPFNGNAADASGNGNDGTVIGATMAADRFGAANHAYAFDGTNDYVEIPAVLNHLGSAFTVSAWIRPWKSVGAIFGQYGSSFETSRFITLQDFTSFGYDEFPPSGNGLTAANTSTLNKWTAITVTRSGSTRKIFVDGVLKVQDNNAETYTGPSPTRATIGVRIYNNSVYLPYSFGGVIDDVRVYTRELSAAEVKALAEGAATSIQQLPDYVYNGTLGRQAITEASAPSSGLFSFVFATSEIGARCLVSWSDTLREWFPLAQFDATTSGTEVNDSTTVQGAFYRTTYLPVGVSPANQFDYPIDTGESVPEQITPERNNLYPDGATDSPIREALSPSSAWRNAQDVGAYYSDFGGLHSGEDWNYGTQSDSDVGENVRAVANGQVIEIRPAGASGIPSTSGYAMVIRHWLQNGDAIDSLYVHIAPDKVDGSANTGGEIGDESDFSYQVGMPVTNKSVIGVIGAVSAFSPHLHFEMRKNEVEVTGPLWPRSTGDSYYGPEVGAAGNRSPTISQSDVEAAFSLMQAEGIIDPSDFIDDNR